MKKKVSYTVEEEVVKRFDEFCKKNSINKSAFIENLIKNAMKK